MEPFKFSVFDIETTPIDDGPIQFRLYGWTDGRDTYHTTSETEAIQHLLGLEGFVYAHNGGRFDFLWFLKNALEYYSDLVQELVLIGASVAVVKCKNFHGERLELRDSYKVLPGSLASLAPKVGEVKLDMRLNVDARTSSEEVERCLSDCIILHKLVSSFAALCDEYSAPVKVTLASQAGVLLEKVTPGFDERLPSTAYEERQRDSFYGGRVEVFRTYAENVTVADVNSLYPFAMLQGLYPTGRPRLTYEPVPELLPVVYNEGTRGAVAATVNVPDMPFPPLPWRRPDDGRLLFPRGRFSGVWTLPELVNAMSLGVTVEPVWALLYPSGPLFDSFVPHFYKRRMESEGEFERHFYKLVLNSAFGKFAQRRETEKVRVVPDVNRWLHERLEANPDAECRVLSDRYGIVTEGAYSRAKLIRPIIAAHVTAYARNYIGSLYRQLTNPESLCYMDTDSLMYSAGTVAGGEGPLSVDNLCRYQSGAIFGGALGQLKIEREGATGFFQGPKMYRLEGSEKAINKIKGVPVKVAQTLERLDGRTTLYFPGVISFRESLVDDGTLNFAGRCFSRTVEPRLDKREYSSDGGSSQPLNVQNGGEIGDCRDPDTDAGTDARWGQLETDAGTDARWDQLEND